MIRTKTLVSIITILILVILITIPVSSVSAKSQGEGIVANIDYIIKDVPGPGSLIIKDRNGRGFAFYAEGEGAIDCNECIVCKETGLDGQTVTIQQRFKIFRGIDGRDNGHFKVYTAGRLQLPSELPAISFLGKGKVTAERISDGTYDLTMELNARTKSGGKLAFDLTGNIDIDDSTGFLSGSTKPGDLVDGCPS